MKLFFLIDKYLFNFAKIIFFLMVFLVSFDAVGRYFFNAPILGAFELTERYLLPLIIFLSISMTWKMNGHIRITILYEKFSFKIQSYLKVISLLVGIIFLFLIAYEGFVVTYETWSSNLKNIGILPLPKYLQLIWIPIGAGIACIHLSADLLKILLRKNGVE